MTTVKELKLRIKKLQKDNADYRDQLAISNQICVEAMHKLKKYERMRKSLRKFLEVE